MSLQVLFLGPDTPFFSGGVRAHLPARFDLLMLAATEAGVADPDALRRQLASADFLMGWTRVSRAMLEQAPALRLVQLIGSGHDLVDLDAARERGVVVATVKGANADSCGELVFGFVLALYRRLEASTTRLRQGDWIAGELRQQGLFELRGKTLGLVGFGTLGQAVARIGHGFGVKLLYHKRHPLTAAEERRWRVRYAPLDELMARSDIVSVQVQLSPETRGLIGRQALSLMKPTALICNIGRGPVIDEAALAEALLAGRIAGAGLDVFEQEPLAPDCPLLRAPNVVLTPHVAGSTREAVARAIRQACENIRRVAGGRPPRNAVT